jgi:SAM-dependent methyltransferase
MPLSETARKQGALWGAEARDWAEIQERTAPLLWRAALDAAGVGSGTRLLDAGCGAGGASVAARERGAIVSGCDASEPLLAIARERLPDADLRLGELENLPFPDRAFDVVLAINCMQFTRDPLRAAQDLVRVTGPAARIVVVVWSIDQCEQRQIFDAVLRLFETPPKGRGVFALSGPGEVEALFPTLPAETIEVETASVYPTLDIALRGQMSAGPSQRVAEIFGREKVEATIREALRPFMTASGEVRMQNRFRCVVIRL